MTRVVVQEQYLYDKLFSWPHNFDHAKQGLLPAFFASQANTGTNKHAGKKDKYSHNEV